MHPINKTIQFICSLKYYINNFCFKYRAKQRGFSFWPAKIKQKIGSLRGDSLTDSSENQSTPKPPKKNKSQLDNQYEVEFYGCGKR